MDVKYVPKNIEDLISLIRNNIPGDQIDVRNITDMSNLFEGSSYNHPLDSWDVSHVTNMERMFFRSKYNHPLGSWDVRNVRNVNWMFYESQYNHPLDSWDLATIRNMSYETKESQYSCFMDPHNRDIRYLCGIRIMDYTFANTRYNHPLNSWNAKVIPFIEKTRSGTIYSYYIEF